jgi:threonine dehydratase
MSFRTNVEAAARRIRPLIRHTPVERSPMLGEHVWLKCENHQLTGSFKIRGATNALKRLDDAARTRGVVTASSGNHGLGLAMAATQLEIPATVFVPTGADDAKVEAIQALGVTVERVGDDCVDTEAYARLIAEHHNRTYISPYNDQAIITGQGTIGLELAEQVPDLDAVFVAMGGGGLIAGVGAYLKSIRPDIQVIGCSPAASPAMHACLEAGRIVDVTCRATLSDATAGGVEPGAITLEACQSVVDRSVLVGEAAIATAVHDVVHTHHMLIEGAAGVAVAGFRSVAADFAGQRVAIILCGANIGSATLKQILNTKR